MCGVHKVLPRGTFSPVTVRPDELERCLEFILKRVGATEGFVQGEQLDQSSGRDYKWQLFSGAWRIPVCFDC